MTLASAIPQIYITGGPKI